MTRRFDPTPLPDEQIAELVDLARRAPSAGFSQGVHFIVLTGTALERFWDVTGAGEWFDRTQPGVHTAPAMILPVADPVAYTSRYAESDKIEHGLDVAANWEVPFWITDTAMAIQNLLLLAEDRGLGALYYGLQNSAGLFTELGVPDTMLQVGAVALGRRAVDDVPSGSAITRPRRPQIDVVHWQRW